MASKPTVVPLQYTTEGVFVAEYASVPEASKQTGIRANNIYRALTGSRQTAGSYMWRKKASDTIPERIKPLYHHDNQPVAVLQHDPQNGNVIDEYKSVNSASRQTGVNQTGIRLAMNGLRYTAGGYEWTRK